MLALFNHNLKPPESLAEFPHLFVEKMQIPLALTNMPEDESRLWNRVNSDVVLRLMGKGGNGPERGDRTVSERGGVSIRAGRGGSLSDRGRGRGRGYYHRNNYEESGDSPPERRDFRNRTFERNLSLNEENVNPRDKKFERSFSRGGGIGGAEDNSRKNNSRSSSVENWRTGGRGEDREGWRTARGPTDNWNNNRSGLWRSGGERGHSDRYSNSKNPNDLWDDISENDRRGSLPEWSLDDGPDLDAKVGTFDASGAFREDTNDDEETKYDDDLEDDSRDDARESLKSDDISKKSNQNSKSLNNEYQKESKIGKQNQNTSKSSKSDDKNDSNSGTNATLHQSKHSLHSSAQSSSQTPSNSSNKLFKANDSLNSNSNSHNIKNASEEDGFAQFAHLEKEAENMVAQWTADDEPKHAAAPHNTPPVEDNQSSHNSIVVLPVQHEDAFKWFYRDPQNEIQGPFTPHEMYDWFTAGYFAMDLLVRRGCDEYFSQLGELFKHWGCIPFILVQGSNPPPLRTQSSAPSHPSASHPMAATQPHHLHHQLPPHASHPTPHPSQPPQQQNILTNQQSVDMQSQLRQLLAQLKKQDGFSELSQQQQQEVLVQRYVHLEQQRQQSLQSSIPIRSANEEHVSQQMAATLDGLSGLRIQNARPQPMVNNNSHPQHVQSIWDMNSGALSVSAIEEMQRKEQELKELEERRKAFEDEQNRKKLEAEELQRHMNEERERKFQELQKKLEEERLRNQELLRKQEEEKRRREEEERLRIEEEERRTAEEQERRHKELLRLEEYARRQAHQEEEKRRQIEMEKERQRQQLHDMERERALEMERLRQLQQQQQQQEAMIKLQQQQEKQRKGWGQTAPEMNQKQHNSLSLDDIQRLQEEKDREEKQRQMAQQKHIQALYAAQQQQQQQNKQSLGWAAPAYQQQSAPVKTLSEIQKEEADKLVKQRTIESKRQQTQVTNNVPNAGIWTNANNQLFGQAVPPQQQPLQPTPKTNNNPPIGFWEPEPRKPVQTNRATIDSALPSMQALNSKGNTNNTQFYTKSNARDKKEEESVLRLFENQRRQKTDEFTQWCIEALSKYQTSVDIPTFIAFLKDVESPFEISDYVRSYLGEGKDVKEFAKQFIERRSYFRNRAKKEASEELMWGPAPAITPSVNKLSQSGASSACAVTSVPNNNSTSDADMSGFITASKKKNRKAKRVVDNSILGFTVQADPDRMPGEIEQMDD
ncbi:unnamed protein product [Oppiella nova]|uniref:GYF domain-containing protein n=1 Tax=Oppiella nova TaxID=334625 RepID=A0A7R9LP36_9ACAR|nr:unnamed protein product [Oppiella nova]CAG2165575.1 unnamed protein product [Oppiella nova]